MNSLLKSRFTPAKKALPTDLQQTEGAASTVFTLAPFEETDQGWTLLPPRDQRLNIQQAQIRLGVAVSKTLRQVADLLSRTKKETKQPELEQITRSVLEVQANFLRSLNEFWKFSTGEEVVLSTLSPRELTGTLKQQVDLCMLNLHLDFNRNVGIMLMTEEGRLNTVCGLVLEDLQRGILSMEDYINYRWKESLTQQMGDPESDEVLPSDDLATEAVKVMRWVERLFGNRLIKNDAWIRLDHWLKDIIYCGPWHRNSYVPTHLKRSRWKFECNSLSAEMLLEFYLACIDDIVDWLRETCIAEDYTGALLIESYEEVTEIARDGIMLDCDHLERIPICYVFDDTEEQMESLEGIAVNVIESLITNAASAIGKSLFGDGRNYDSPTLVDGGGSNCSVVDQAKKAVPLVFKAKDCIENMAHVMDQPNDEKAMDIKVRCSIPSRVDYYNWTTSSATGTLIMSFPVDPMFAARIGATPPNIFNVNTVLSFYGESYTFWRGSLKIIVEVICTKFHQGQLFFAFNPNFGVVSSYLAARNCSGATMDLSVCNRLEIEVPFVYPTDYARVRGSAQDPASSVTSVGQGFLFIQNPLAAPNSVSNTVSVNVYIAAGSDFEFKVPRPAIPKFLMNNVVQMESTEQMGDEVIELDKAELVVAEGPLGGGDGRAEALRICSSVSTAASDNVLDRDYLLLAGINWPTVNTPGTVLTSISVPGVFNNPDLAVKGLTDYHEFNRFSYEITIRVAAAPMYAGCLIMYYDPLGIVTSDGTNRSFGTFTQLPCVFLNPGFETSATLKVPYVHYQRLLRNNGASAGTVHVAVWNQLFFPTASSTSLTFSVWGKITNGYAGVKKALGSSSRDVDVADLVEQMESDRPMSQRGSAKGETGPTNTAKQDSCGSTLMSGKAMQSGFLVEDHMNVKDLMRRIDLAYQFNISNNSSTWSGVLAGPEFVGREHTRQSYVYLGRSGSNRLMFTSDTSAFTNSVWMVTANYQEYSTNPVWGPATITWNPQNDIFRGAAIWWAAEERCKTVSIPHYSQFPIIVNNWPNNNILTRNETVANVEMARLGVDAGNITIYGSIFHTVGDDFNFYFPLPMIITIGAGEPISGLANLVRPDDQGMFEMKIEEQMGNPLADLVGYIRDLKEWCFGKAELAKGMFEFATTLDGLRQLKEWVLNHLLPMLCWIVDFVSNLYILFTSTCVALKGIVFVSLTAKCATSPYGAHLLEKLQEVGVKYAALLIPQDDEGMDWLPGLVATALVAGVLSLMGYALSKEDAGFVKRSASAKVQSSAMLIGKIGSVALIVPKIWEMVRAGVESALNYLISGKESASSWYTQNRGRLSQWMRDSDSAKIGGWFEQTNLESVVDGISNFDRLRGLAAFAQEVKKRGVDVPYFSPIWLRTADELIVRYADATKRRGVKSTRQEPIGILISGKSGAGKSLLCAKILPHLVLTKLGLIKTLADTERNVYSAPTDPLQRFKDGYYGQVWYGIDDFGTDAAESDVAELINLISVAQCPMNMARLETKDTLFSSSFICASTNLTSFQGSKAIKNEDALPRRFPYRIRMEVRREYLFGKALNFDLAMKTMRTSKTVDDYMSICDRIWSFTYFDMLTGVDSIQTTLPELVDSVCAMYEARGRGTTVLDNILGGLTAQMDDGDLPSTSRGHRDGAEIRIQAQKQYMSRVRLAHKSGDLSPEVIERLLGELEVDFPLYGYSSYEGLLDDCSITPFEPEAISQEVDFLAVVKYLMSGGRAEGEKEKNKEWKGIWKFATVVVGAAAAVGVGILISKAVRHVMKGVDELTVQGSQYSGDRRLRPAKPPRPMKVYMQSGERSDVHHSVARNLRPMRLVVNGVPRKMYGLAIDSKHLLAPYHFVKNSLEAMSTEDDVKIQIGIRNSQGEDVGWKPLSLARDLWVKVSGEHTWGGGRDLVVVRMENSNIDNARSIEHQIATSAQFEALRTSASKALILSDGLEDKQCIIDARRLGMSHDHTYLAGVVSTPTEKGDCGRPYVIAQSSYQRPLLGVHVAISSTGLACCAHLSVEDYMQAKALLAKRFGSTVAVEPPTMEKVEFQGSKPADWESSTMSCKGKMVVNGVHLERYQAESTDFVRTGLHHAEWVDRYLPSQKERVRVDGVLVRPLIKGAQKYNIDANRIPSVGILITARRFMRGRLDDELKSDKVVPRLLSEDETINGFGSLNSIVVSTSPGWWSKWFTKGKKELLVQDADGKYSFTSAARKFRNPLTNRSLVEQFEWVEKEAAEGREPFTFWLDTLKDELRDKDKVAIGKTRVFEQPGLEFSLLVRKYFGSFLEYYRRKFGFNLMHGIGADYEAVWGLYYKHLKRFGGLGFDLDYSEFDGRLPDWCFECFLDFTDHFYGPENRVARHAIVGGIRHAHHVVGQYGAESFQGNKSGVPMTDVLNSVSNCFIVLTCYMITRGQIGLPPSLEEFDEDVAMLTYGDDVIMGVEKDALNWFNRVTIKGVCDELGLRVTAASKSAVMEPFDRLEDIQFLKKKFIECDGYVAGPLPIDVIHRSVIWERKDNVGQALLLVERIRDASRHMAHQGGEELNKFLKQLKDNKVNCDFDFQQFELEMRALQEAAMISYPNLMRDVESVQHFFFENLEEPIGFDRESLERLLHGWVTEEELHLV